MAKNQIPPAERREDGERHDAEIVSDFLGGGYWARCSCGWESDQKANNALAEFALANHREAPDAH